MSYILIISLLVVLSGVLSQEITESEIKGGFVPSLLLESARQDDVLGIRKAIADGTGVDITNANGWTAAMFAVSNGKLAALHALVDAGIDLNQGDKDGRTPLMLAAQQGDKEMVEVLLNANADPSLVNSENVSAYDVALQSGRQIVALQIAESCVLRGIYKNDVDLITISIKRGAYINIPTPAGWTALIFSSSTGNKLLTKELLKLGADVNRAESDGWTPLHFAAHNGHKAIVDILLSEGANFAYLSKSRKTAKDLAKDAGNKEIVEIIPDPDQDL
jgi:ankyrin repeat protein